MCRSLLSGLNRSIVGVDLRREVRGTAFVAVWLCPKRAVDLTTEVWGFVWTNGNGFRGMANHNLRQGFRKGPVVRGSD